MRHDGCSVDKHTRKAESEAAAPADTPIEPDCKLFVSRLDYAVTRDELEDVFKQVRG